MIGSVGIEFAERGILPDWIIRRGIRRLCRARLKAIKSATSLYPDSSELGQIAYETDAANQQHYELPPEFFELVLGSRRKYSCCFFESSDQSLDDAEVNSLKASCDRAQIYDGANILELGCGWGSLTLWMAESFPNSQITAVSNSQPQRKFIEKQAVERNLSDRIQVITADINGFAPKRVFDRIVSIEMFEHVRNHEMLFERMWDWLTPEGKLFVHVFCHREKTYLFDVEGPSDWMSEYFFTGGIMPSATLLPEIANDWTLEDSWLWDGKQYQLTAEAWVKLIDQNKQKVLACLGEHYGKDSQRWFNRWRIFFLAVAELFGFAEGQEWVVKHYLFKK